MNESNTNDWEERFDRRWEYKGEFQNKPIFKDVKNFIRKELALAEARGEARGAEKVMKDVSEYLEHSRDCILSFYEAGRPTIGGGYEQKFKGKWYEVRPIDKTPKCDCGLSKFLTNSK